MTILFTRFPLESSFGGAEVQTLSLMKGLREKGHEVSFLGSCSTLLERCQVSGVRCQKLDIGPPPVMKWGALSFLWRKRGMQRKLISEVARFSEPRLEQGSRSMGRRPMPPDAAQSDTALFMLSLSEKLLLTEWAVAKGIKVFWIEHDRIGRWLTKNPWLPKLKRLSTLATTITVSDLSRDLYLKMGWDPEKTIAIPNGVETERFGGTTLRGVHVRDGRATFRIGCIARLTHDKGVDLLIEAVKDLPNVTLTIVGTGREEKHIRPLIQSVNEQRKTNNEKRMQLLAKTNPAEFYKEIDVLVLPSRSHDPFGLVIAEAMASGIPTILTDACGIARHLSKEDALIVHAGERAALKDALEKVQKKEVWEALAARGPVVAQEKFSLAAMVEAYAALL